MKPISINQISDQVLAIKWDDDSENIYFAEQTRGKCPCASCKDSKEEKPSSALFKVLKANPNNVIFKSWEMIGRYAIRFTFSDGHGTGIYTYEYLKKIGE